MCFFQSGTVFLCSSVLCLCPCSMKNCPDVHFKSFSIIKGSISLGWKLHCWFIHSALSLFLSQHVSSDDICSNHWVMSQLMLSATSKVQCQDADIFNEAEEREVRATSWTGYVRKEKKKFDISLSVLPFVKPSRTMEDCVTALYF